MTIWLGKALMLAIHARQISEHGGTAEIRDEGLLESAIARPQQLHAYGDPPPDIAALAASLAYGLARNHPFVDGNKRTAHVAYRTFLLLNGTDLVASDEEKYIAMLGLAEGSVTERQFAVWLRERIGLAQPGTAHQPRAGYAARRTKGVAKPRKKAAAGKAPARKSAARRRD